MKTKDHCAPPLYVVSGSEAILPVLDESNSGTLFTEALATQVETVFAD